MRPPSITPTEFDVLLKRAGIEGLAPAERAGIHAVWGAVEAMLESVRTPAPGADEVAAAAAEPAVTFAAGAPNP
jgi:hypothetical protein